MHVLSCENRPHSRTAAAVNTTPIPYQNQHPAVARSSMWNIAEDSRPLFPTSGCGQLISAPSVMDGRRALHREQEVPKPHDRGEPT